MVASATYIVNDLLDLESDRQHPTKRNRPFAARQLSVGSGLAASVILLVGSVLLATFLPKSFSVALAAYLATTVLYSLRLKRIPSLDVVLLAGLYTLRVVAGAWATDIPLSFWLLAFSMFLFLCLALAKRVAELLDRDSIAALSGLSNKGFVPGRSYSSDDRLALQVMGAASGYLAVLVLALYINSPEVAVLYATPQILWLIAPAMLLWVTRLWIVTSRGKLSEDPVIFAMRDPETWSTAAFVLLVLLAATYLRISL
jgi:4-hydroxybenzoate polyprenyltransferase